MLLKTRAAVLFSSMAVLVFLGASVLYAGRIKYPMLYYQGASPELPDGKAFVVLNPFRGTKDERNAEWLIRDLKTDKCEQLVRERLRADPNRICPALFASTKANLIWMDADRGSVADWKQTRRLIYDLPERKARLEFFSQMTTVTGE